MTSERGNIRVQSILLSEDIARSMSNNRQSLINMYSGVHIVRGAFPVLFQVGIGIMFTVVKTGAVSVQVHLKGDVLDREPDPIIGDINIVHAPNEMEPQLLVCGVQYLDVVRPGTLEIHCKINDGNWEKQRAYRFKHKPYAPLSSAGSFETEALLSAASSARTSSL